VIAPVATVTPPPAPPAPFVPAPPAPPTSVDAFIVQALAVAFAIEVRTRVQPGALSVIRAGRNVVSAFVAVAPLQARVFERVVGRPAERGDLRAIETAWDSAASTGFAP